MEPARKLPQSPPPAGCGLVTAAHLADASGGSPGTSRRSRWRAVLAAARPQQWTKNVLVFAAPIAAGVADQASPALRALATFGLFCLVASGSYLINDALDVDADRAHPLKRLRPVAAGLVPVPVALGVGAVLEAAGVALALLLSWQLAVTMLVYVALQVAYNVALKHLPGWDLACVAAGFVLRAIAGGVAVGVPVSQWFLIVATFGSLLMVTGKRLAELLELGDGGGAHRRTLSEYSATFLRTVLAISAAGAVIGYSLWALDLRTALRHHSSPIWFELSIVPVVVALLHYTFLVEQGRGARPERLVLKDRSLQVLGFAWVVLLAVGVYGR